MEMSTTMLRAVATTRECLLKETMVRPTTRNKNHCIANEMFLSGVKKRNDFSPGMGVLATVKIEFLPWVGDWIACYDEYDRIDDKPLFL